MAQVPGDYSTPELSVPDDVLMSQTNGKFKPAQHSSNQHFKILIVFAEFQNDNRTFTDWTYGQLPNYAQNLVSSTKQTTYPSMTISDYWDEMSMGNLDIIGDIYPTVVRLRPESYYQSSGLHFENANKDVVDSIDENVNFSNYDLWSLNSATGQFQFTPDGYVDMIYIIYRNPVNLGSWFTWNNGNFGAIAILGYNMTYTSAEGTIIDGKYISSKASGITVNKGANVYFPDFLAMICHESGHYYFGAGHTKAGGLMAGEYSYKSGTFALNGWEKERLGYAAYTIPTQDNFTITLNDFVSSSQVLQVPINGSSTDYYIVENHQRVSIYDQMCRGGSIEGAFDTIYNQGKGIYIYKITGGNSFPPTIDVKTANGNWDWTLNGTIAGPSGGWPSLMPLSGRASVNRYGGKSDRDCQNIYYNNNWWEKWHDTIPLTKSISLTRNIMGLPQHAFNLGYNTLFTNWSSPSTMPNDNAFLGIEVYSQNGNYITVKTYNTLSSVQNLPPSKPQNLKVSRNSNYEAVLTWEPNIEPDIKSGKYRIYKATTTGAEPTSYTMVAEINAYVSRTPVRTWTDINNVSNGGSDKTFYKISAVDNQLQESIKSEYDWVWSGDLVKSGHTNTIGIPETNQLLPNYPNPFNPSTNVSYSIKERGTVEIKVYDMLGKIIATLVNQTKEPGTYTVQFNGDNLPSGIYFCSMKINGYNSVQKMILQK